MQLYLYIMFAYHAQTCIMHWAIAERQIFGLLKNKLNDNKNRVTVTFRTHGLTKHVSNRATSLKT